ncbi:hypothetical protein AB0J90_13840 [Micromonospora sp. NPDC049523]|uniref:MmyB family transcriptional regulator n=1 Tax=Micromonospora sp. NPDC049523 TaxID=3155921 RepID=UPI003429432F
MPPQISWNCPSSFASAPAPGCVRPSAPPSCRNSAISRHVAPALRQLVDGLGDSPAQVMTLLGETILQNPMAVALLGDHSIYTGDARNSTYRWFTDPTSRSVHPPEEHEEESLSRVAELRARSVRVGDPEADRLIGMLRAQSPEFERIWLQQRVAICRSGTKALVHPAIGTIELECQILRAEGPEQLLVAFTAATGSRAAAQLRGLGAVRAEPPVRRHPHAAVRTGRTSSRARTP